MLRLLIVLALICVFLVALVTGQIPPAVTSNPVAKSTDYSQEAFVLEEFAQKLKFAKAGHLCHMYRRMHRTNAAIEMCRLAVYRIPMSGGLTLSQYATEIAAAQENLKVLTTGTSKSKNEADSSDLVIRERTFRLPRFLTGTETAEFFVLFAADGKNKTFRVEDTKFISGSDKMKGQGKQLKAIDFSFPAPGNATTRFVRRGILGCYAYTGCSFVLLDPASVHSLD